MVDRKIPLGRYGVFGVQLPTQIVFILILSCTFIGRVQAGEVDASTHASAFHEIDPDYALVYFVNDLSAGTAHVYLDTEVVGVLPQQAYTAFMAKPGFRLVWGSSEARWYELKAGWAYLLRLVKVSTFTSAWVKDNPGMLGALVADKKLRYITADVDTRARLRLKANDAYQKAVRAADDELALPHYRRFHALDLKGKRPASMRAER